MKKLISKLKRIINNLNIRTKLLFSFFLVVFIPVIILGVIFINRTVKITMDFTVREFLVDVDRIEKNITDNLETAKTLSDRFYVDERLESILINKYTSLFELTEILNNYTDFDYYNQIYKDVSAIRVYTTNSTIKENWRFMNVTKSVEDSFWYQQARENKGKLFWTLYSDNNGDNNLLRLSRSMPFYEGMPFSVLTVDIFIEALTSLLNEEASLILFFLNSPDNDDYKIITTGGKADNKDDILINKSFIDKYNLFDESKNIISINNTSFFKEKRTLKGGYYLQSFSFIVLFPMEDLNKNKQNMFLTGSILMFICLIASIVLIYILSHHLLSKRIRFLGAEMHKIATGNLDISLELEGKDEIGYLSKDIMKMITSLKELMKKVYEADLQKKHYEVKQKDMELKLLASQINPHFFFNALETIRAKARTNRIGELEEIVKALGRIMRESLEIQKNPVSIQSEIDFTLHYLEIQKYRFEEKLEYEVKINDEIQDIQVIPHLLQPIVENAIIHGIEQKIGGGKIFITAFRDNSSIILEIKDNGVGIPGVKLDKIQQALMSDIISEEEPYGKGPYGKGPHGIGLINVHHRIRLYYGEPYGIQVNSEKDKGTKVKIILPYQGRENNA